MGSDSDLPTMKDAARILDMFGVPSEVTFSFTDAGLEFDSSL